MREELIIAKRGYKIDGASVALINKSVEDNWLTQDFGIWCWDEKHHNYLAIVTRDENGEDKFNWLKKSKNSDEYFNISKVKKGDILLAGSKRRNKGYSGGIPFYSKRMGRRDRGGKDRYLISLARP